MWAKSSCDVKAQHRTRIKILWQSLPVSSVRYQPRAVSPRIDIEIIVNGTINYSASRMNDQETCTTAVYSGTPFCKHSARLCKMDKCNTYLHNQPWDETTHITKNCLGPFEKVVRAHPRHTSRQFALATPCETSQWLQWPCKPQHACTCHPCHGIGAPSQLSSRCFEFSAQKKYKMQSTITAMLMISHLDISNFLHKTKYKHLAAVPY